MKYSSDTKKVKDIGAATRRTHILSLLKEREEPVSGTELARLFGVSRQIIVQDIALLRAQTNDILSTYRGYIIRREEGNKRKAVRVFCVNHKTEATLDELQTIVDRGGRVMDVFVEHGLYGHIRADLYISNRMEAAEFVERLKSSSDLPLKSLTGGCHYHTVTADSEKNLDAIEEALREKGYLS